MPADVSEPHVAAIRARKIVLSPRKPIAALAHRLRATQSPPTNAEVRMRMGPLGAGLLRAMHDLASAVLMRNRRTSEAPHGAVTPLPGTSRCAETASKVVMSAGLTCSRPAYSIDFLSEQGGSGRGSLAVRGRCFCW